jgi:hypothetical protein
MLVPMAGNPSFCAVFAAVHCVEHVIAYTDEVRSAFGLCPDFMHAVYIHQSAPISENEHCSMRGQFPLTLEPIPPPGHPNSSRTGYIKSMNLLRVGLHQSDIQVTETWQNLLILNGRFPLTIFCSQSCSLINEAMSTE